MKECVSSVLRVCKDLLLRVDQNANAWLALASSQPGMPAEAEAC